MKILLYFWGAMAWHLRAALWYLQLGFRLYFAVGLDQDFDPAKDNTARHFQCPHPRHYRRHLQGKS